MCSKCCSRNIFLLQFAKKPVNKIHSWRHVHGSETVFFRFGREGFDCKECVYYESLGMVDRQLIDDKLFDKANSKVKEVHNLLVKFCFSLDFSLTRPSSSLFIFRFHTQNQAGSTKNVSFYNSSGQIMNLFCIRKPHLQSYIISVRREARYVASTGIFIF
jgi:hypothetical protein